MGFRLVALGSAAAAVVIGSLGVAMCAAGPVSASEEPTRAPLHANFLAMTDFLQAAQGQQATASKFPKVDPKDEIPLPEGPGKDTTKRVCGNCHSTNIWIKQRHSAEKWNSIIDNMISKGMEASEDDIGVVGDYLGTYLLPPAKDAAAPTPSATPQP